MIVRFYMTTGQVFDTKAPEPDYNLSQPYALHEVEEAVARELAGITTGDYGSRKQVRPPACVTVTMIGSGGGRMILMTAQIVRVQVLED